MEKKPDLRHFPKAQIADNERWILDVLSDLEMYCQQFGLRDTEAAISRARIAADQELPRPKNEDDRD